MEKDIGAEFEIVHKETGERYKPNSRGAVGHTYASRFAAEEALSAMPTRWRGAYRVQMVLKLVDPPKDMQAKHTEGPWNAKARSQDGIGDFTNEVRVYGPRVSYWVADCGMEEPERLANARLIASAPDLLAALESLYKATMIEPYGGTASDMTAALNAARAAIAKARGGAQ
jgi:hypothetical protein